MKADGITQMEESLYLGHIHQPCGYLPDRAASLLYLRGELGAVEYRAMLDRGYRRSGDGLYRPDCPGCSECRVLRVPLITFRMSRSQRRVWRRGQSVFRYEIRPPSYHPRKLRMYSRYLVSQHGTYESDLNEGSYRSFFVSSFLNGQTLELSLYAGDRLAGLGIVDVLPDALSSVYFFFDPDFSRFSPGAFSMLLELDLCRQMGLRYYYPGYFIERCPAMNYKGDYGPAEICVPGETHYVPFWRGASGSRTGPA